MTDNPRTTPTLTDLRRELADLRLSILEDDDWHDHWPEGRWPMVHKLAGRIDAMERNNATP